MDAVYWINLAHEGARNGQQYTFAVRLKANGGFIGGIGLKLTQKWDRAELGYWIAEPFWNRGYATEAAAAVLRFGFETLALNKIYATHLVDNPASGRVMIKNGMIREGELKEHMKRGDQYRTVVQYRLTREEYFNGER